MRNTFIILSLSIILNSCEDQIIQDLPTVEDISGKDELQVCVTNHKFGGLETVSNISDIQATLHWTQSQDNLGYSIFMNKENGPLEFIESITSNNSDYTIKGLTETSNYSFLVKSISQDGLHDCNTNFVKVITPARITFKSCFDIKQYYGNSMSSGIYEVDLDLSGPFNPINVFCEMDLYGGGWTRIFTHKTISGLFSSKSDALIKNPNDQNADLYSILSYVEYFKRNNKFEFWLNYPQVDLVDEGNHWSQTSNPTTSSISNYVAIRVDHTAHFWGGLEAGGATTSLIDGSVNHTNWYFSIGSYKYWPITGTVPGPNNGVNEVYLYVR